MLQMQYYATNAANIAVTSDNAAQHMSSFYQEFSCVDIAKSPTFTRPSNKCQQYPTISDHKNISENVTWCPCCAEICNCVMCGALRWAGSYHKEHTVFIFICNNINLKALFILKQFSDSSIQMSHCHWSFLFVLFVSTKYKNPFLYKLYTFTSLF